MSILSDIAATLKKLDDNTFRKVWNLYIKDILTYDTYKSKSININNLISKLCDPNRIETTKYVYNSIVNYTK